MIYFFHAHHTGTLTLHGLCAPLFHGCHHSQELKVTSWKGKIELTFKGKDSVKRGVSPSAVPYSNFKAALCKMALKDPDTSQIDSNRLPNGHVLKQHSMTHTFRLSLPPLLPPLLPLLLHAFHSLLGFSSLLGPRITTCLP